MWSPALCTKEASEKQVIELRGWDKSGAPRKGFLWPPELADMMG